MYIVHAFGLDETFLLTPKMPLAKTRAGDSVDVISYLPYVEFLLSFLKHKWEFSEELPIARVSTNVKMEC